jgi:hypothetical protein
MNRRAHRWSTDDGSAIVEFVWLTVLLLVPLTYVVLTAVSLQRAALGATTAVRAGARAYATADSDADGERRAETAMTLAMRDQGVGWEPTGRVVTCGSCDYAPGSAFTVDVDQRVALPLMPSWLCGHRCATGIVVSAHHADRLGCYIGTGPPAPGSEC